MAEAAHHPNGSPVRAAREGTRDREVTSVGGNVRRDVYPRSLSLTTHIGNTCKPCQQYVGVKHCVFNRNIHIIFPLQKCERGINRFGSDRTFLWLRRVGDD